MSSIQATKHTNKKEHWYKQSAQTRALGKHLYISGYTACLTTKQFFFNFCNTELISIAYPNYNYHAASDVGMLGKMCRVSLVCAPCLPVFLVWVLCRPVPIHPFEIFLLACLCTFLIIKVNEKDF